ncbi:hypothetical protein BSR09_00470 [Stutzerimonas degradans]|nr:hypothetical protein BSR09_00470 [Stutzerimonas degradans]
MSAVAALALILAAPLLLAFAMGAVLPKEISLAGMIVAFFLGSIVSVFVASEAHAGKIRSASDLWSVIAFGYKAFGWWAAGMAACGFFVWVLYMGVGR